MAAWSQQTLEQFRSLGDQLNAGPLNRLNGLGPQRHVTLARQGDTDLCVGWMPSVPAEQLANDEKRLALWAS